MTEEEELTADEVLLRRMDAGLYTLQQSALIIGNLWIVGDQGVKQRLLMLLHQQVCNHISGLFAVLSLGVCAMRCSITCITSRCALHYVRWFAMLLCLRCAVLFQRIPLC